MGSSVAGTEVTVRSPICCSRIGFHLVVGPHCGWKHGNGQPNLGWFSDNRRTSWKGGFSGEF